MPVAAGCVRLPDLHQHVAGRGAGAVEDAALDDDPLSGCLGRDQHVGKVLLEDIEAGLVRDKPYMDIRAGGLRRGLFQRGDARKHALVPLQLVLEQGGAPSPQHDVKSISQAIKRHGRVQIQGSDEPLHRIRVGDRPGNDVMGQQRIAFEIHLRDQALRKAGAEDREMDMRRTQELT